MHSLRSGSPNNVMLAALQEFEYCNVPLNVRITMSERERARVFVPKLEPNAFAYRS